MRNKRTHIILAGLTLALLVTVGYSIYYYNTVYKELLSNPSIEEVVEYAQEHNSEHIVEPDIMLAIAFIESGGFVQYDYVGDVLHAQQTHPDGSVSTLWGMSQLDDARYSEHMVELAKSHWQDSFDAGWYALDVCYFDTLGDPYKAIACYRYPDSMYSAEAEHYVELVLSARLRWVKDFGPQGLPIE